MMSRRASVTLLLIGVAALGAGVLARAVGGRVPTPRQWRQVDRPPSIRPDYSGVVIPPNIAPLNFSVDEPGAAFRVTASGAAGRPVEVTSRSPSIAFPLKAWRRLLEENRGGEIQFGVLVMRADGEWVQFEPIANTVSEDEIDRYLAYRIINVLYNYYSKMRMHQRDLTTSEETLILDGQAYGDGCMNCHTFFDHGTDRMIFHMRSGTTPYGHGMILIQDGEVRKISTRTKENPGLAAFSSWHPSGEAIVFSTNKVRQFFHSARAEVREGIDMNSDLNVYVLETGGVISPDPISDPDLLETWPEWAPDGRHLYFCRAPRPWSPDSDVPPPHHDEAIYDLMRISYDVDARAWGEVETVLSAEEMGASISEPRISPDGRFLLFCAARVGGFPALRPEADIHLLDLTTGEHRRLECNSDESDSWPNWSRNGRWIVFSSKRGDGLFMKPWFSHVDAAGRASKAFVMPQRDPAYYDSFMRVYHVPELVDQAIPIRGEELARIIREDPWLGMDPTVTGATPGPYGTPWSPPPAADAWSSR